MSASETVIGEPSRTDVATRSVPSAIARLEARRHLRHPVLWLGIAASAYSAWRSRSIEWSGGTYSAFPVDLVPAAWAVFVLGVLAGGRDHIAGPRPSPAVAVAAGGDRIAAGRLLSLLAPLAVLAALVAGIAVTTSLTGGHTIGESFWRTDAARHSLPEVAQPILLATLAGVAGVAIGRAVRHAIVAIAGGTIVLFAFGLISWAWQWSPAVYVTPVQQQPFSVEIDHTDPTQVPSDWWLSSPGQYQDGWRRLVVDPVVASGHDLVLVGATAAFAGWAVRGRWGRLVALGGLGVAAAGVIVQLAAKPW
jgi:hypothetical protein